MTEAEALAAVLALLNTGGTIAYTIGDLQKMGTAVPQEYVEVGLSRMFGGQALNDGRTATTGYRITTRAVALKEPNAREMARRATTRLEGSRVGDSTPVAFESADTIGPDDGWFSGLTLWTFVL